MPSIIIIHCGTLQGVILVGVKHQNDLITVSCQRHQYGIDTSIEVIDCLLRLVSLSTSVAIFRLGSPPVCVICLELGLKPELSQNAQFFIECAMMSCCKSIGI